MAEEEAPPPPAEDVAVAEGDAEAGAGGEAEAGAGAEGEGGEGEGGGEEEGFPVILKDSDEWKNCAAFGHWNVDGGPPEGAWPLYMQPDTLEEYGVPKIDDQICWGWVDKAKVQQESQDKGAMCDWDPIKANLFAIEEEKVRRPCHLCAAFRLHSLFLALARSEAAHAATVPAGVRRGRGAG
eukprot:COSAG02_NODE_1082_length_14704_cov_49.941664_8_plen_182_part_00